MSLKFPAAQFQNTRSLQTAPRIPSLLYGASILALLSAGLAMPQAAWAANGGQGRSNTGVAAGVGGTDGTASTAVGRPAPTGIGTFIGGGGGAVDLTTGQGGAGGSGFDNGTTTGGTGGSVGTSSAVDLTVGSSGHFVGGVGGFGAADSGGGGGGVAIFSSASVTVQGGGAVIGGTGGQGNGFAGGGGGAAAILMTGGATVDNSGTLVGGAGGAANVLEGGAGGDGGEGVLVTNGGTVINRSGGSITGGAAGRNGQSIPAGVASSVGGVGIKGANINVVNAGTISGAGAGAADAIAFTGGVNSLEIQAGSTITGNVVAFSTADTLKLGGDTASSFDLSTIGPTAKYQGFGLYEKTGASIWTLTGATTAVTPWTLTGGELSVDEDAKLGDASGALTFNGGILQVTGTDFSSTVRTITWGDNGGGFDIVEATDNFAVSQSLTGNGSLTKLGAGTLTLTGTNTYAGGTTISGGTLVGAAGSLGTGAILDNAALVIDQPADAELPGAINGNGTLLKQGVGRLNLTGGGDFSGPVTVAAGTLSVNGALANAVVTVNSGATLGGNGTVGATTIQTGATIAPGNSVGTLSVNGAFVQNAGSLYQVEVDPTSNASDRIAVDGTASIADGATLNVTKNPAGGYRMGADYTVLSATGGVTGTYAVTGDTAVSGFLALEKVQDANNIYLQVVETADPASAAQTPNQLAVAGGVDSQPIGSGAQTAVLNSPTMADARSAFDKLSGEALASANGALIAGSLLVRDTALDRLRDVLCVDKTNEGSRTACASNKPIVWTQGFGSWGHISSNGNSAGLSQSSGGFLVGVDIPVYDWRVGYFGGFSRTDFDVKARSSSGNSNTYHLGTYGGTQWGDLGLRLGASYSWNGLSTDRSVTVGDLSNDLRGNYNAGTAQVFGELGQRFSFEQFTFEPFANVAYVNLRTGGFSETGGDAALTVKAGTMEDTFTTLGVRPSTDISLGSFNATVRGMAGWRHAFGDVTPSSVVSFAGSDTFTVTGAPISRDAGVVEAGLDFTVHDNVTAGITYGGQFGSRETDHSIRGNFAITF